ncbi:MAG: aminotransferase class III-fold pyridoxal phosphate-dependent enzyme [Thermodesulfobacteriota bacterium]
MKKINTSFPASEALWERAGRVIPAGTQTLSKGPDQFVFGATPMYLERGRGSHVWDVDGNEYIDYPMALGPILLGYGYKDVVDAVVERMRKGTTFTLMHPLEVELAELLTEIIPCAEMVRFAKNGSDVTSAAVRVARACTGREHIAYCGYHGCQDWYAVTTPRNRGIPASTGELIHAFEYNRIETLSALFDEYHGRIAAVIMEVPGSDPVINLTSRRNFLQDVALLCKKHGALFILDEMVTGFRYSLGGAGELFDVVPDLACFGKGMGNGMAVSALVGKREFMSSLNEVFFSMTFSGDTTGLSAAKATIETIMAEPVIEHIWARGARLHKGLKKAAAEWGVNLEVSGRPPRAGLAFRNDKGEIDPVMRSLFLQETVKRGVLFGGPLFISYSHSDSDIDKTIEVCYEAFSHVRSACESLSPSSFLEGQVVGEVFRSRR